MSLAEHGLHRPRVETIHGLPSDRRPQLAMNSMLWLRQLLGLSTEVADRTVIRDACVMICRLQGKSIMPPSRLPTDAPIDRSSDGGKDNGKAKRGRGRPRRNAV